MKYPLSWELKLIKLLIFVKDKWVKLSWLKTVVPFALNTLYILFCGKKNCLLGGQEQYFYKQDFRTSSQRSGDAFGLAKRSGPTLLPNRPLSMNRTFFFNRNTNSCCFLDCWQSPRPETVQHNTLTTWIHSSLHRNSISQWIVVCWARTRACYNRAVTSLVEFISR